VICGYFHSIDHVIEDCPQLLAKLEEKREKNIHMVIIEPCNKPNKPTNVRVIIRGGVCRKKICSTGDHAKARMLAVGIVVPTTTPPLV